MPAPVRFGVFEWDPAAGELRKRGLRLSVPGQSLAILGILVERAGEVVTRDEIRERLWPDGTVVEFEHSVSSAINRLRSALGDSATSPRYIETLPRKGYRFLAQLDAPPPPVPNKRRHWAVWTAAGAVLALGAALAWTVRPATPKSVAVLPFVNLSGNAEQDHLVEGLTEEVITRLSQTASLMVVSRTSAMRYRGVKKSVAEIANELGVRTVVEGSMQWSAGRVRVTVQLIDASTDRHLWSKNYDSKVSDVLALRDEVASAIAEELKVQLLPRRASPPVNPDAYEAFLKGRYFAARMNRTGQAKAASYFEEAVRLDPAYAPAWAGLSHAVGWIDFWDDLPFGERCRTAMQRAMQLDPTLPEAQINYADLKFYNEWNWKEGEAAFRRIVEQAPGSADAREHYGLCLRALGRFQEAAAQAREAVRLDPLSPATTSLLGSELRLAGRPREAIDALQRAVELDPSHAVSYRVLGWVLEDIGKPDEALSAYLKGEAIEGRSPDHCEELRRSYARGGLREYHRTIGQWRLRYLQERAKSARVSPKLLAETYVLLGDTERALDSLEEAYRQRCPALALLRGQRQWDPLRGAPRFEEVLRRMGLK